MPGTVLGALSTFIGIDVMSTLQRRTSSHRVTFKITEPELETYGGRGICLQGPQVLVTLKMAGMGLYSPTLSPSG